MYKGNFKHLKSFLVFIKNLTFEKNLIWSTLAENLVVCIPFLSTNHLFRTIFQSFL